MNFKKGDIVYGYAVYHKIWDYCVVESIFENVELLFGRSKNNLHYYKMEFSQIVPEQIVQSPLWKALE
jgi:hypothetical protein